MDRSRNMAVALGLTGVILGAMAFSVWTGTKPAASPGGRMGGPVSGGLALVTCTASFNGPVPGDLGVTPVPGLSFTIRNGAAAPVTLVMERVVLRKYDFLVKDTQRAVVSVSAEVSPYILDPEGPPVIAVAPGRELNFAFTPADYLAFYPGQCDVAVAILPGGLRMEPEVNLLPYETRLTVRVTAGTSVPRRLLGVGGGALAREIGHVNGKTLTETEFIDKLIETHGQNMFQQIMAEKVVWQALDREGVRVNGPDIDYALKFEQRSMAAELKGVPFEEYLKTMNMTEAGLREDRGFLLRIAIRKHLSALAPEPGEETLPAFFQAHYDWYGREEMVRARKIVIVPTEKGERSGDTRDREQAVNKLLEVKRAIESGATSFPEAVRLYSQDVRARVTGGDMEPFRAYSEARANDVARIVAEVGFRLEPGRISTPLEVEGEGFILLQVIERIPPVTVLFRDVRTAVARDQKYEAVSGDQIQVWIQGLLNASDLSISPEYAERFTRALQSHKLKHYETDLVGK
ncbi:MAG: peptidylprolyl isomerase [Planctomycetota bacterium]